MYWVFDKRHFSHIKICLLIKFICCGRKYAVTKLYKAKKTFTRTLRSNTNDGDGEALSFKLRVYKQMILAVALVC